MGEFTGHGLIPETAAAVATAVRRFYDEVFCCADDIDPNQEMDWTDMAFGFLVGAGIPADFILDVWLDLMQAGDIEDLITDLENIK